jgi:hypothetical protein
MGEKGGSSLRKTTMQPLLMIFTKVSQFRKAAVAEAGLACQPTCHAGQMNEYSQSESI